MNKLLYEFLHHLERRKMAKWTVYDYSYTIGLFFSWLEENYPEVKEVTEITRQMLVGYEKRLLTMKDKLGKVLARNRRQRHLVHLRVFFGWLEWEEKMYSNPTTNLSIPSLRHSFLREVLSIKEMERLIVCCKGDSFKGMRDRTIMELLYSTGMRAEELCSLQLCDVDLEQNLVAIRKGKGGKERLVPFGSIAGGWLTRYLTQARPLLAAGNQYLFPSLRGKKFHPAGLLAVIKYYAREAGIEKNVTSHTFRHSCATHMLKGKADIRYVQRQLGHEWIATTEHYLKLEISDLKEVHRRCHPRERGKWDLEH